MPIAPTTNRRPLWKLAQALAPPAIVVAILVGALAYALYSRLQSAQEMDQEAIREWLDESRVHRKTLPELIREYLGLALGDAKNAAADPESVRIRAEEIHTHVAALGNPTKMHQEQLPLFPVIYQITITFQGPAGGLAPITWDSGLSRPRHPKEIGTMTHRILGANDDRAAVTVAYQLHAYNRRQEEEVARQRLLLWIIALAVVAVGAATVWAYFILKRQREREIRELIQAQQLEHAERLVIEAERTQLEQAIAIEKASRKQEEAERRAAEMETQLFRNIGIMAGSYAHNIKNLLVRPNELLRRCLDGDGLRTDQRLLLEEIDQTLHTVTDRLQLILKTVRRDPTQAEFGRLDLNELVQEIYRGWHLMAEQKWKFHLRLELCPEPLWVTGDRSHLTQAMENLLFNARDATFEMRNHLRDQARKQSEPDRRRAVIAAAAWKGEVCLQTFRRDAHAVLEVSDNGIGMNDEVLRRCIEPHFTTKRDNALHQGHSTGMGLGLPFVQAILRSHGGQLEIASEPLQGATFRLVMPLVAEVASIR